MTTKPRIATNIRSKARSLFRGTKTTNPTSITFDHDSRRVYRAWYRAINRVLFNGELPDIPVVCRNDLDEVYAQVVWYPPGKPSAIEVYDSIVRHQDDKFLDNLFRHEALHVWLIMHKLPAGHETPIWAAMSSHLKIDESYIKYGAINPFVHICTVCDQEWSYIKNLEDTPCPMCGNNLHLVRTNYSIG